MSQYMASGNAKSVHAGFALRACAVLVLLFVCGAARAVDFAQSPHTSFSLPMDYPTGVYWPWERTDAAAGKAGYKDKWGYAEMILGRLKKEWNCNLVWVLNIGLDDASKLLALAEKAGIYMAVSPSSVDHVYYNLSHADAKQLDWAANEAVKALKGSKALAAYVLLDEPPDHRQWYVENIGRRIRKLDPTRPCTTVTMWGNTPGGANRMSLPIVTTDLYPFFGPGDPNGPHTPESSRGWYRGTLRQYLIRSARQNGKTPWVMPGVFQDVWGNWRYDPKMNVVVEKGSYHHWRQPTIGESRWMVWAGLAEGAKGIVFYLLMPSVNERKAGDPPKQGDLPANVPKVVEEYNTGEAESLLYSDSTPTRQFLSISEAFAVIGKNAAVLKRLVPADAPLVFFDPPIYGHTYIDPETGAPVAIIYSDDTDKEVTAELTSLIPLKEMRSLTSGKSLPLTRDDSTGMQKTTISLLPGGGAILTLTPADGSDVVLAFKEALRINDLFGTSERRNIKIVYTTTDSYVLGEGNEEAVVGYDLETLIKYYPPESGLYVIAHGNGPLAVQSSADGKTFNTLDERMEKPIRLSADTRQFRFILKPGAYMRGFELVAVRGAQTSR